MLLLLLEHVGARRLHQMMVAGMHEMVVVVMGGRKRLLLHVLHGMDEHAGGVGLRRHHVSVHGGLHGLEHAELTTVRLVVVVVVGERLRGVLVDHLEAELLGLLVIVRWLDGVVFGRVGRDGRR